MKTRDSDAAFNFLHLKEIKMRLMLWLQYGLKYSVVLQIPGFYSPERLFDDLKAAAKLQKTRDKYRRWFCVGSSLMDLFFLRPAQFLFYISASPWFIVDVLLQVCTIPEYQATNHSSLPAPPPIRDSTQPSFRAL